MHHSGRRRRHLQIQTGAQDIKDQDCFVDVMCFDASCWCSFRIDEDVEGGCFADAEAGLTGQQPGIIRSWLDADATKILRLDGCVVE